jgi:hypothetical protein
MLLLQHQLRAPDHRVMGGERRGIGDHRLCSRDRRCGAQRGQRLAFGRAAHRCGNLVPLGQQAARDVPADIAARPEDKHAHGIDPYQFADFAQVVPSPGVWQDRPPAARRLPGAAGTR